MNLKSWESNITNNIVRGDKMNKWINYEDVIGEGSNTYECPYCDFILQLMEGTPEENLFNYCPRCGKRLIVKTSDINEILANYL